jgi:hypothetical protein
VLCELEVATTVEAGRMGDEQGMVSRTTEMVEDKR